ncbi:MAG: hypothetical protein C5B50_03070 [Verrucomicrobia bacterium]|nr:MAG: hypothetical protein C5B50_03070 [Verrucomicrobiota bacterium]
MQPSRPRFIKEALKDWSVFLFPLAFLVLIGVVATLFFRGLPWIAEKLKAMGMSEIAICILGIVLCVGIVVFLCRLEKRSFRKARPERAAKKVKLAPKAKIRWGNEERGWLCAVAAGVVFLVTMDMASNQQRIVLCVIAYVAAWPVTAIRKIGERPGLCAAMVAGAVAIYVGGDFVWRGMTHRGPGIVTYGGDEPGTGGATSSPEFDAEVPEAEYRRKQYEYAFVFFIFGAVFLVEALKGWKERNKEERIYSRQIDAIRKAMLERRIPVAITLKELERWPGLWGDDFVRWARKVNSDEYAVHHAVDAFVKWTTKNHPDLLRQSRSEQGTPGKHINVLLGCNEQRVTENIRALLASTFHDGVVLSVVECSTWEEIRDTAHSYHFAFVILYPDRLRSAHHNASLEHCIPRIKNLKESRRFPIIALTSMPEWLGPLSSAGADACLETPFTADQLIAAIDSSLPTRAPKQE